MNKKVREYFKADRFALHTGIEIDQVGDNEAVCSLGLQDYHLNAKDYVQGGVIFTLADFAFAVAANGKSIIEDSPEKTVSASVEINYIKPGDGKLLTARAVLISKEKHISYYAIEVTNDRDEIIAKSKIKGFTKK